MVVGLPGNKSPYSNRLTLVFQSLRMMYDYKLNLVVRTPRACPWESSEIGFVNTKNVSFFTCFHKRNKLFHAAVQILPFWPDKADVLVDRRLDLDFGKIRVFFCHGMVQKSAAELLEQKIVDGSELTAVQDDLWFETGGLKKGI